MVVYKGGNESEVTRPDVGDMTAATRFDPRPPQWHTEPTFDAHPVAHDYGPPATAPTEGPAA